MQIENLVPFPFYQRLTQRERVLLLLVVGTAFLLGNLYAIGTVVRSFRSLRQEYRDKSDEWDFASHYIRDKPVWDAREGWLSKVQPRLTDRVTANYALPEQIQSVGRQYKVVITNPKILTPPPGSKDSPAYQPVTMSIETRSEWSDLVHFLAALQQKPDNFLAFDDALLRSEPSDPNTMTGSLKISKWYAPGAAGR